MSAFDDFKESKLNDHELHGKIIISYKSYFILSNRYPVMYTYIYLPDVQPVWKFMNFISDKIIKQMFENVEINNTNTDLVRLRIAINMIDKLPIDIELKQKTSEWLKGYFWERKRFLQQWYLDNVLPF